LLVVDQSPVARERLRRLFESVAGIEVVADAGTVEKALRLLASESPTAVLLDCDLPGPGSFEALRQMMGLYPIPVVMLAKQTKTPAADLEARALETGAVALAWWTPGERGPAKGTDDDLIRTVRAMAEVKVVRRRGQQSRNSLPLAPRPDAVRSLPAADARIEVVAIGASTGGPPVLQTILAGLPRPLPVPIVLVQHLSRGFQKSLAKWLGDCTGFEVQMGENGRPLSPGIVYLAPDDSHMLVGSGHILLSDDPPENGSRPSVSVLFRSVALHYGPHAIGILLTGMGRDGAKELRLMRDCGAVTIAQDEETSVVHGMPGEAIKLKGARYVLAPERIPSVVQHHVSGRQDGRERGPLPVSAC
jgi:two-component system chemotaxis response regulator CheB